MMMMLKSWTSVAVETMNIWLEFGADLFDDEAGQDVHDKASQSGIHGEGLDDGTHEQHGEGILLHQLLHHHRQNLRRVHVLLPKAQVGSCRTDAEQFDFHLSYICNISQYHSKRCYTIIIIRYNKTRFSFGSTNSSL